MPTTAAAPCLFLVQPSLTSSWTGRAFEAWPKCWPLLHHRRHPTAHPQNRHVIVVKLVISGNHLIELLFLWCRRRQHHGSPPWWSSSKRCTRPPPRSCLLRIANLKTRPSALPRFWSPLSWEEHGCRTCLVFRDYAYLIKHYKTWFRRSPLVSWHAPMLSGKSSRKLARGTAKSLGTGVASWTASFRTWSTSASYWKTH